MKTYLQIMVCSLVLIGISFFPANAQFLKRLKQTVQDRAQDRADDKASQVTDKAVDSLEGVKGSNSSVQTSTSGQQLNNNSGTPATASDEAPSVKTYQNYDFVPGDKIIFYDNFSDDQDGEFPAHWNLLQGQGVVNKVGNDLAFFLTEGNYAKVSPRMKTPAYLTDPFTVEFDYYIKDPGGYGINLFFKDSAGNEPIITFDGHGDVNTSYLANNFRGNYPGGDPTVNNWHHGAFIFMNGQIKCYIDQYRILVDPSIDFIPVSLEFGGIGSQDAPIIFKNVRVASGGDMNTIRKKFTASKIVTHGIHFGIDRATIEPQSMGTLNMIVSLMKNNPDLKFEVDGHTDNSGDAAHNLALSMQRADAVKAQFISMGIDESRLTTKGFGDTKPIDTNDTPEGLANNRRVEFVKK
jgi:OOP family OmpA-OmpF porin